MSNEPQKKHQGPQPASPTAAKFGQQSSELSPVFSLVFISVLVVLTALIYSNTLNSFVLDDYDIIVNNHHIRISEISFRALQESFQYGASRPIPLISYALNYYAGKYNPFGYHIVNITIHALNGILLFFLISITLNIYRQLPGKSSTQESLPIPLVAFLSALLWVVHPGEYPVRYLYCSANEQSGGFI